MYGGDAGGQSIANEVKAAGLSYAVAAGNAEVGISFAQTAESALNGTCFISAKIKRIRNISR